MKKPEPGKSLLSDKSPFAGNQINICEYDVGTKKSIAQNCWDFYKIILQFGTSRLEYADKVILIDQPALQFTNPLIPKESFDDPSQKLWAGRSADEVLFGVAANYKFVGFEVLLGYHCYDVFHNKHIKQDLENYPAHLEKVLN